jgi:hypothetical protein
MKSFFLLAGLLVGTVSLAQDFTIKELVLKEATEEMNKSVYPLFQSSVNPKAASVINKTLQMADFGMIWVEKNPQPFLQSENVKKEYSARGYELVYQNNRCLLVRTIEYTPASMNNRGVYPTAYYFSKKNGDRLFAENFFTTEGWPQIKKLMLAQLEKQITRQLKEWGQDSEQGRKENADCIQDMRNIINEIVPASLEILPATRQIKFAMPWCEDSSITAPQVELVLRWEEIYPSTTAAWKYYWLQENTTPASHPVNHVWTGTINNKIPVTIMLRQEDGSTTLHGLEVYDNYGGGIRLGGKITGNTVELQELGDKDQVAGVFELTNSGGKMSGLWKKPDGSKSYPVMLVVGSGN